MAAPPRNTHCTALQDSASVRQARWFGWRLLLVSGRCLVACCADVRPEQCRRLWPESAAAAVVCEVSGPVHVPDGWASARCGRARVLKPLGGPVLCHRLVLTTVEPSVMIIPKGVQRVLHAVIPTVFTN